MKYMNKLTLGIVLAAWLFTSFLVDCNKVSDSAISQEDWRSIRR